MSVLRKGILRLIDPLRSGSGVLRQGIVDTVQCCGSPGAVLEIMLCCILHRWEGRRVGNEG